MQLIRVQFNDKKSMQQVKFNTVSDSVVKLTGNKIPRSDKGFKAYRLNGAFLGDYSAYTEIVAEDENSIQYGMPQNTKDAYTE